MYVYVLEFQYIFVFFCQDNWSYYPSNWNCNWIVITTDAFGEIAKMTTYVVFVLYLLLHFKKSYYGYSSWFLNGTLVTIIISSIILIFTDFIWLNGYPKIQPWRHCISNRHDSKIQLFIGLDIFFGFFCCFLYLVKLQQVYGIKYLRYKPSILYIYLSVHYIYICDKITTDFSYMMTKHCTLVFISFAVTSAFITSFIITKLMDFSFLIQNIGQGLIIFFMCQYYDKLYIKICCISFIHNFCENCCSSKKQINYNNDRTSPSFRIHFVTDTTHASEADLNRIFHDSFAEDKQSLRNSIEKYEQLSANESGLIIF